MGCCSSSEDTDEVVIELNTTTNAAVQCHKGRSAEGLHITNADNGNIIVKAASSDSGGIMLGSCSLDCDVAYWEVKIIKNKTNNEDKDESKNSGSGIGIGLKKFQAKNPVPLTGFISNSDNDGKGASPSWSLNTVHLGKSKEKELTDFKEGDIIGVHWDQTDFPMVSFTLNGNFLPNASITRIRPAQDIYPAISIHGSNQIVEVVFDSANFTHKPLSSKFGGIICASSLI